MKKVILFSLFLSCLPTMQAMEAQNNFVHERFHGAPWHDLFETEYSYKILKKESNKITNEEKAKLLYIKMLCYEIQQKQIALSKQLQILPRKERTITAALLFTNGFSAAFQINLNEIIENCEKYFTEETNENLETAKRSFSTFLSSIEETEEPEPERVEEYFKLLNSMWMNILHEELFPA